MKNARGGPSFKYSDFRLSKTGIRRKKEKIRMPSMKHRKCDLFIYCLCFIEGILFFCFWQPELWIFHDTSTYAIFGRAIFEYEHTQADLQNLAAKREYDLGDVRKIRQMQTLARQRAESRKSKVCTLEHTSTHCNNALQRTATHHNALQRTAARCNAL